MKMTKRISSFIAALLFSGSISVEILAMRMSPQGAKNVKKLWEYRKIPAFPFTHLPKDLQNEIMVIIARNEIDSLPQEPGSIRVAADKIRELAVSNKAFNDIINQREFTLQLIKSFAKAFHSYEGDVAKVLGTRGAQERLALQKDFENAIRNKGLSENDLNTFLKKGVDLTWVSDATPLMIAVAFNKLATVKLLLKHGADVNQIVETYNLRGEVLWHVNCFTALSMVVTKNRTHTLGMTHIQGLLQPARYAEALEPISVQDLQKTPISQVLEMIKVLLDAGADPEPECCLTLNNVEFYSDRPEVIKAIRDAQAKKAAAA